MIKSYGGYGILVERAIGNGLDQGSFACVLKSDYSDFQLFIEEPAFDPIQHLFNKSHHLYK